MEKTKGKWLKILITGLIFIIFFKLLDNSKATAEAINKFIGFFTPCIIGVAIAFFLWRPTQKLENLLGRCKSKFVNKIKMPVAVILVYILIIAFLAIIINFIVPQVTASIKDFAEKTPSYITTVENYLNNLDFLDEYDVAAKVKVEFFNVIEKLLTADRINGYISAVSGVFSSFMSILLGIILSLYILLDKKAIRGFCKTATNAILKEKGSLFSMYFNKIVNIFYSYFAGLLIDSLIIATIATIAFSIFKVPYALILGIIVGACNMVPIFGPIVAGVVTASITAVTMGPLNAVWVVLFQIVLAQVDANVILPRVVSGATGVKPILVLLSVIVFGNLFGFAGMILGVPVTATLQLLYIDYVDNGSIDASKLK